MQEKSPRLNRVVHWTRKLQDGSKVKLHYYYRTLQDCFDVLIENNFFIERYLELERLEENALPASNREEIKKDREARRFYKFMNEVPCSVIFKARKSLSQ